MTTGTRKIDEHGIAFIEQWEAFVGYVYDDKVPPKKVKGKLAYPEYKGGAIRGTLTIGIGHTSAAKADVDMSLGAKLSHAEACRILDIDLDPCEAAVNRLVKVELTQGQFNALVSFVYNCGEGAFKKSSILSKLNRGNYAGARASLALYNKSKGEVMLGLKRRRAAEQAMWDEDELVVAELNPTKTEEAKSVPVPKTDPVVSDKSVLQSTEAAGSATQTGAGTIGMINEFDKAMEYADKAIIAKKKAEELGVNPIDAGERLEAILGYLIHSPVFWLCLVVTLLGIYLFLRRKWRLKQEL